MIAPRTAFKALLGAFGPQGWWPLTPAGGDVPVYRPGKRGLPDEKGAFEICVGAILTQNTAWSNVVPALKNLSRAGLLNPRAIRRRRADRLARSIKSSGYFRQKTLKLKRFSEYLESSGGGALKRLSTGKIISRRKELLGVFGIGPETADSMLLYAGGRRIFVVDAYTRRIGSRLGWFQAAAPYDDIRLFFEGALPRSVETYRECHALLVELGKRACRPRPVCGGCPLKRRCLKVGVYEHR